MSLITKVAYLSMCAICGIHGRIVYADGTKSVGFVTKARGLLILGEAREAQKVSEEEAQAIKEQIQAYLLIDTNERVDALYDSMSEDLDSECDGLDLFGGMPDGQMLH